MKSSKKKPSKPMAGAGTTDCSSLQKSVDDLSQRISDLQDALDNHEIPPKLIPGVKAEIAKLRASLVRLEGLLKKCLAS
jgi:hypothetical protein